MNEERVQLLTALEKRLAWHFTDISLLENALTHRSFVNENAALACQDNERLEFLGDAVLELTVSDMLMRKFPCHTEGQLSKLRASVVNEQPLAELARRFGIGEVLRLGKGEEASGGRNKTSLLANAFESVIAAMFCDGGFDRTAAFIAQLFEPLIGQTDLSTLYTDYKTAAQELCQVMFREMPRYTVVSETGPDHDKRFESCLVVGKWDVATGTGRSKKEAEQQAARAAIEKLQNIQPTDAIEKSGKAESTDPSTADGERNRVSSRHEEGEGSAEGPSEPSTRPQ